MFGEIPFQHNDQRFHLHYAIRFLLCLLGVYEHQFATGRLMFVQLKQMK